MSSDHKTNNRTSSSPRIAIPEPTSDNPVYNQRSWSVYAGVVEEAGGVGVRLPLNESQASLAHTIHSCSGVLLPGSPADIDPEEYGERRSPACGAKDSARESVDDLLLKDAFDQRKPIFGICYGLQSLNVWRNGTLIQHLPPARVNHKRDREVEHAHAVECVRDSMLLRILSSVSDLDAGGRLSVNSSHHQAIDRPGDQLAAVAISPEDGVIEALELQIPEFEARQLQTQFVLGVQWHPERTYQTSAASRALFAAFIEAASAWKRQPTRESVGL